MTATATQIARLRRMVAEPTTDTYDDDALSTLIEEYPLTDSDGYESDEDDWTATYDLHAAAGDVWEEKAASVANRMDFDADGGNFSASQLYDQYQRSAAYHLARRSAASRVVVIAPEIVTDAD